MLQQRANPRIEAVEPQQGEEPQAPYGQGPTTVLAGPEHAQARCGRLRRRCRRRDFRQRIELHPPHDRLLDTVDNVGRFGMASLRLQPARGLGHKAADYDQE
ncbi:hypothetical protein D9M69_698690 [compost metagenome]